MGASWRGGGDAPLNGRMPVSTTVSMAWRGPETILVGMIVFLGYAYYLKGG